MTPDHLNRYESFEEYARTKAHLFAAQSSGDWAILNYGNPVSRRIGYELQQSEDVSKEASKQEYLQREVLGSHSPRRVWFTSGQSDFRSDLQADIVGPPDGCGAAWVEEGLLNIRLASGCEVAIMKTCDLPPTLSGAHSVENVLAASAAALALSIAPDIIATAVRSFPGVPHRLEWVRDLKGIRYINNSMCTNVEAAISSLQAMDRPTIAIMGGADKQLDYAPLVPALHAKVKHVILIGQVADKMEEVFRRGGYVTMSRAASLSDAVQQASALAMAEETVLLIPACASFDMFRDFEARGMAFRHAVAALTAVPTLPE